MALARQALGEGGFQTRLSWQLYQHGLSEHKGAATWQQSSNSAVPCMLAWISTQPLPVTHLQLVAATQAAAGAGAPSAAWHKAWRRVAAAHVATMAAGALASTLLGQQDQEQQQQQLPSLHAQADSGPAWFPGSVAHSWQQLVQQLLWAAVAGLAAAEGPAALLAALSPAGDSNGDGTERRSGSSGEQRGSKGAASSGQVADRQQAWHCTRAVALAVVVLQGAQLLMGQWARCFAFLALAVPLHALTARPAQSAAGKVLMTSALLAATSAAAWQACSSPGSCGGSSGAPWLASMLLPHLLSCLLL